MMDNRLDDAEKYFQQSLKYNSHNPTSMYHMAQVEARRKNYSSALTWINHSIHINPNSSPALNLQGELYLRQGNQAAAINSFKKAVAVKPENRTCVKYVFYKRSLRYRRVYFLPK